MQRRAYELQREWVDEEPLVPDLAQRLAEIEAPALVVVGEEDQPDMQAIVERLARELPNARRATIPATAHVPSMERPQEFDALVLPFLEEVA
jgi:pimeloyl-ACP methyl ester carboxylesterase